ncbi:7TM GPCR serpentine receptor class x (Srx) domain-containing protein [Caenorhabditis elegans]|uniref:7TM GPCR serpentine receptor class x (Srx) domain-containing protein n=1 Tax=Caenorhabditis elegans TaxID=6239 RepID=O18106_CAEEL|nr:7TM GPCR serpentine receptor class x (Srx) domain-containing protein [Caenorhabditis elegans]CAB03379.2 7TM GPCR serpentine receptor class x (Srx) domain-containing protein [Caenorhabditis elegans]|eukprot:NP_496675.2 Serpentine Receptor, class X [Caenorhabditis elegans]
MSSVLDEFLYSEFSTPSTRTVSAVMLIVVSIIGSIMNVLIFIATFFRVTKRDGFLKICCFNSFGSCIVCIGYLAFPVPSLLLEDPPNHWLNAAMGQFIAWFGWSIGPLSQILLTVNRIIAVYFPLLYMKKYRYNPTNVGIGFSFFVAFILLVSFFPEGCHYLFNRDYLGWVGEFTPCIDIMQKTFLVVMMTICALTTCCSVLLFIKLIIHSPNFRVSNAQLANRHRKNRKLIIQAIVQSILIIVDSLNSTITYNLFPNLFFQFITLSFSMVFLRTLEGFVVFSINETINEEVKKMLRMKSSASNVFIVPKRSMSTGQRNYARQSQSIP